MAEVVAAVYAAGGIHDRHRNAVVCERLQALFDLAGGIDPARRSARHRDGGASSSKAVPWGSGLDQADIMSGPDGGKCKADGKRAFSRAALLGWPVRSSAFLGPLDRLWQVI